MRRYTRRTRAQYRMPPVLTIDGRAAASRLALVARSVYVAKISAPGSLQQVPPDARHVANLGRSALQQRLGNHRIVGSNLRMHGGVAHLLKRTDTQSVCAHFDSAHQQSV